MVGRSTQSLDCVHQLIGFFVGATGVLLWFIGGNAVVALHYRRRGLGIESGFTPFINDFRHFTVRDWALIGVVAVFSLGLIAAGITIARN